MSAAADSQKGGGKGAAKKNMSRWGDSSGGTLSFGGDDLRPAGAVAGYHQPMLTGDVHGRFRNTPCGPYELSVGVATWRLTWWQNVLLLVLAGLLIANVVGTFGMAWGMIQTQPQLEETTAQTRKMGQNMDELKDNAEKFWAERMMQFGADSVQQKQQYNLWARQASDIVASVHQVMHVLEEQARTTAGDVGGLVHAGVSAVIQELVPVDKKAEVGQMIVDAAAITKHVRGIVEGLSKEEVQAAFRTYTQLGADVDDIITTFSTLRTTRGKDAKKDSS